METTMWTLYVNKNNNIPFSTMNIASPYRIHLVVVVTDAQGAINLRSNM